MNTDEKDIFPKFKPAIKWWGEQLGWTSDKDLRKSVFIRPALRYPWLKLNRSGSDGKLNL